MKQEVSFTLRNIVKFLTVFLLVSSFFRGAWGKIVHRELFDTHLRWNIEAPKDEIAISRDRTQMTIKSLSEESEDLLDKIESDVKNNGLHSRYFKSNGLRRSRDHDNRSFIELQLRDNNTEVFTFYRDGEKKYVIDFWNDVNVEKGRALASTSHKLSHKLKKRETIGKFKEVKKVKKVKEVKKFVEKVEKAKQDTKKKLAKQNPYRDFRYGAPFIWDYDPIEPILNSEINIERKTPEFFYPIENRQYEKNEREAHLQLAINLYRKKKWGLMYKSIKLFQRKYGDDYEQGLIEYIKANTILRENLLKGNKRPAKIAVNMLSNLAQVNLHYPMKRGILKYLIQYYVDNKEYVKALELSKKLYVLCRENHDYIDSQYAARVMLYNFSKLKQIEKIDKLILDKEIKKILPRQVRMAYKIYTLLKLDNGEEIVKIFEREKKGLVPPIERSIVFNVAEAYFRLAKYEKSLKLFDDYIASHSYSSEASRARVRIALAYEILERNVKETLELYKNAINRSQDDEVGQEARIRYVALRSVRKKKITDADREVRVFLDRKKTKEKLSKNIKKLLWIVRLRTFIVDGKFKKAFSYLNVIPLQNLSFHEQRAFESDGAEIVHSMLLDNYQEENYSKVIKVWELYRDRYINKVAHDPYLNLVVGKSYLKLGLYKGLDDIFSSFEKVKDTPRKTFPVWKERPFDSSIEPDFVLLELNIVKNMKLKNWDLTKKGIESLSKLKKNDNKLNYYRGLLAYENKEYKEVVGHLEKFLTRQNAQVGPFDDIEIADILMAYTDSIYQLGDVEKFQRVSHAVLKDTKNYSKRNPYLAKVKERISYLNIEILYGNNNDSSILERRVSDFKENYKNSIHLGRVDYILGLVLIENNKVDNGKKILTELIKNERVSDYIKELARSELSLLKINERTI